MVPEKNNLESEILKKAKKGEKVKRIRPRYPRFLLPLFIVLIAAAVVFVPMLTDIGPNISEVIEAFAPQKSDLVDISTIKKSSLEEYAIEGQLEIIEDENAINGVILTPEADYAVDTNLETTYETIVLDLKENGFNSIFFNLNYKDGYLTAVGGKNNLSPVSDGLKIITQKAKANEIRLFAVIDVKNIDLCKVANLKDLLNFITAIQKTEGVSGVMLKGVNYLNNGLTYNDYLKLGHYNGFEEFTKEIFYSNIERLSAEYKAATNNGYLGIFCEVDYDNTKKELIYKDKLKATDIAEMGIFDSVITYGLGATSSVSHPFKEMASLVADAKDTDTRMGFMLYSSKINNEYSNPDQLTRQLMVLNDLGLGTMVFDSYKAIKDDTTGAAATAIKYMKGNLTNYQPKGLTFSAPAALDFTTSYSSIAISGASDPEFELLLDGKPVERTESGFFSMQKNLKVGDNVFTFTHKGTTRKIYVTYTYTVLKSVSPSSSLALDGGSVLVVKANARIGSVVKATLNGQTVTLKQGVDQSGESTDKDTEFTVFEGKITLPEGKDKIQDLGKIKFTASHGGIVNTGYSGTIKVNKKPDKAPIYSPITHEGVKPGNRTIAEVTASYVETFDGDDTTDDLSRPTNSYLPKGTIDYVSNDKVYNAEIKQYYILFGYNKRVYKSEGSIKISTGSLPSNNTVGIKSTTNDGQYTTLVLDMTFPFPHNIDVKPQNYTKPATQDYTFSSATFTYVEIFLPYTTSISGNANFSGNPLFTKSEFAKVSNGYVLKLHLKEKGKFYGYTSYFDANGNLVVRFLNPNKTTGNSLAGVNILLDPGHGGTDGGAVGYDNKGREIKESETCLELCLAVKEKLTALGANVTMTRSTETSLATSTRSSIIRNSNAHLTVSIHRNSATNANAYGLKTYHFSAWQKEPATYIMNSVKASSKIDAIRPNYGKSAWARVDWHWFGYARISNMPVVLIEAGFMSNAKDLEAILNDDFNDAQAEAIVEGIVKYFNNQ